MSELKLDVLEQEHCATVDDVLVELGGVYSFHPFLKQATLAKSIYDYYKSKLISSSEGIDGIMYYIDEVSSDDKCNQLIVSIVKGKRKRLQISRMILRAVIKIIVPGPPSVGFYKTIFHVIMSSGSTHYYYVSGRKSPHQSEFEQACQDTENAVQCLSMNADWVYHTLSSNKKPCVLDPATGQLEFYNPEGKLTFSFYLS